MPVIVSIRRYGDFDMPYTVEMMEAPDVYTKQGARGLVARLEHDYKDTDNVDPVIAELKEFGFKTVKWVGLTVGGDL